MNGANEIERASRRCASLLSAVRQSEGTIRALASLPAAATCRSR